MVRTMAYESFGQEVGREKEKEERKNERERQRFAKNEVKIRAEMVWVGI